MAGNDEPLERISTFFQRDHREIDAILEQVDFNNPRQGAPKLAEFDRRLERHIVWEEEILFPAVCATSPELEAGPIRVMRVEHEHIRRHKAAALKAMASKDGAAARSAIDAMLAVLGDHNFKEEQILYPACDDALRDSELREVFRRIQSSLSPAA